jgi:hypothetical protein
VCVDTSIFNTHFHPGSDLNRSSNGRRQTTFLKAMFFLNMWRAKDKREFRWKLLFQRSTACNLIDACHCFAGNCSIHLVGRNLTLRRRCSQWLCSKRCHIPENNIFYSYENFTFNCWLMLYIVSQNIEGRRGGRRGTYMPMHTIKVCTKSRGITPLILNFDTGCRWAVSFTPQPFLTVWEKVDAYWMGYLVDPTGGLNIF